MKSFYLLGAKNTPVDTFVDKDHVRKLTCISLDGINSHFLFRERTGVSIPFEGKRCRQYPYPDVLGWNELPLFVGVQRRCVDTFGNVDALGQVTNCLQRALDT